MIFVDVRTEQFIKEHRMKVVRVAKLALAAWSMALVTSTAAGAESTIRIGGNGTGLEVMKVLIPEFEKRHPGTRVEVTKSLGSAGGINALAAGALDLAMSSRPLKEEEKAQGAVQVFSGRTPFVFLANGSVTKGNLTTAEAEAIYLGKLATWPDGSQIKLVLRPKGDTDTKTMQAISPAMGAAVDTALHRPGMQTALTDEDSDRYIAGIPGALGGSSLAQVAVGRLPCRVLSFNGVKPSLKTMAGGAYPLVKHLMIVAHRARVAPAVKSFVEFAQSPTAKKMLLKYGVLVDFGAQRK
jgi:phosphate transport system substrate-binding protein